MNDFCLGVCRRGDLGPRKNLELVEVFNYDEQIPDFLVSEDMHGIYTLIRLSKDVIPDYRAKIAQSVDEKTVDKWILDKTKIPAETYSKLYTADKATGLPVEPIDFMGVSDVLISTDKFVPILDARAFVGGLGTIGSGGIYATLAIAGADQGTFTSAGILRFISAITDTGTATFNNSLDTFTVLIDGAGFVESIGHVAAGMLFDFGGTGVPTITGLEFKRATAGAVGAVSMVRISSTASIAQFVVQGCTFNGNSVQGSGFRCSDRSPNLRIYNNIFCSVTGTGLLLDAGDGNPNSIYENNTYYDCLVGADYTNNAGIVNNESFANCGTTQANKASLSVDTNHVTTAAGALLTDFDSITKADTAEFLRPKRTGNVYGGNGAALISGHTTLTNGTGIVASGAKGPSPLGMTNGTGSQVGLNIGVGL